MKTTADALCEIGISPNVPNSNLEAANIVDALATIGRALPHRETIEAHGLAIEKAGKLIADALRNLADAVRERTGN